MNKKGFILIIVFLMTGILLHAQRKSKLPRISVKAAKISSNQQSQQFFKKEIDNNFTIQSFSDVPDENQLEDDLLSENTGYSDISGEISGEKPVIIHPFSTKTIKTGNIQMHSEKTPSLSFSANLFKERARLYQVKEVEKTAIEVWVLLLIIFYILGVVFTILCILALLVWNNATLFILFLIFAILFSTAGSIMLTLGQMGVI